MRLIKTIIFFVLLGYSVMFCVENLQSVDVTVPFVIGTVSVPLFLVIIACLIMGMVIGSLVYTAKSAKRYIATGNVKAENKKLKKKLDMYQTEEKIQGNIAESLQNRLTDE